MELSESDNCLRNKDKLPCFDWEKGCKQFNAASIMLAEWVSPGECNGLRGKQQATT